MDGKKEVSINATNIPFKCVVCNGFGTLKHGSKTCQACDGLGYVVIQQDGGNDGGMDQTPPEDSG